MEISARQIFKGTFSYSGYFLLCNVLLPIIITPYIYHRIGAEQYGIWALILTLTGWFIYADCGLHLGVSRTVGQQAAGADREGLRKLFCTCAYLYLAIAVISLAAGTPVLRFVFIKLGVTSTAALTPLYLMMVMQVLMVGYRLCNHVQAGLQKMPATSAVTAVVGILQAALACGAVYMGWGLDGLAAAYALSALLYFSGISVLMLSERVGAERFPRSFNFRYFDLSLAKRLIAFGSTLYLCQLLLYILMNDRLYLGYIQLPLALVAAYHLGATMVGKAVSLMHSFAIAAFPASATLNAGQDTRRLTELTIRGFKLHVLAGTAVFSAIAIFADWLFVLWLGAPSPEGVMAARILSLWGWTTVFRGLTLVGAGMGQPGLQLKSALITIAAAGILFPFLAIPHKIAGLALTISLSTLIGSLWYACRFRARFLNISWKSLAWSAGLKATLPALCAGAVILPVRTYVFTPAAAGRPTALFYLSLFLAIYFMLVFIFARKWQVLDETEWQAIRSITRCRLNRDED